MADKKKAQGRNVQIGDQDIIEHDERMVPEFHKGNEIYGEHFTRYTASEEIVRGKIVLDVASGSGYGTEILARTAKKVIGVDVSEDAVEYSKKHYARKNIEYKVGNGDELPIKDGTVDVVTSFETIEHIEDYKKFLREVKRVLTPEGVFVVSTPNDLEFTEGNHFHLHQFNEKELLSLLKKQYKYVEPYYQTTWLLNIVGDKSSYSIEATEPLELTRTTTIKDQQVLYFYFLCSDKPIKTKVALQGATGEHWSERKVREKDHLTQQHITNLEAKISEQQGYLTKLEDDVRALTTELKSVLDSKSYKAAIKMKRIVKR